MLVFAAQAPDWLELLLGAVGRDGWHESRSHSLPVVFVGAVGFALLSVIATGDWVGALLLFGVMLSHPVLDLVTGAKVWWPGHSAVGACLTTARSSTW